MGFLRKKVQEKAFKVDLKRWSLVMDMMEPGEDWLHNTPARANYCDGTAEGYLFLTDRALMFCGRMQDDGSVSAHRIPLSDIAVAESKGGYDFGVGARRDGQSHRMDYSAYPGPLSAELFQELLERLRARADS